MYFNADEIKERAVRGINSVIVSKVQVGKVSLSMLKRFPKTTLILEHVTINDPVQQERFLCKDATLYLDFNSLDLLFGNYNLNHIGLRADFVRLVKHPSQWNYILWKQDSTNTSTDVNINLKSFDWRVDSLYLKVDAVYAESKSSGKLTFQDDLISAETELGFANVYYQKKRYTLPQSSVSVEGFNPKSYQFIQAKLSNALLAIKANNNALDTYAVSGTCYQLRPLGKSMTLNDLPNLTGQIEFQFVTDFDSLKDPKNLEFKVKNLAWSEKKLANVTGNISLPNAKALDVAKFDLSGKFNGFDITLQSNNQTTSDGKQILRLIAKNAILPLESDLISLKASTVDVNISLPKLSELQNNFELKSIDFLSGTITDLKYSMALQNQEIEIIGRADVKQNGLVFESTNSTVNGILVAVDAVLPSVKPLLEKTPKLYLQLEVRADNLLLNPIENKQAITATMESAVDTISNFDYNIELVVDAKTLAYNKIKAIDAYTSLLIRPGIVEIKSFGAQAFDGKAYAKGDYNLKDETLTLTGFVNEMSAENVLKTFDNFNQDYVSYTNCRGSVDINFDFQSVAFWNKKWGYSKLNVHMYNAELKDLPFLSDIKTAVKQNKFAKFILNEDELFEKLSFINLQEAKANFVLEDETVIISDAIFRSPEINLNSAGEYNSRDEQVDFEFQLYIKDFFAKSANEDNYYVPETKGSKLKFYLRGDADNPDVGMLKRDKKPRSTRPAFKQDKEIDNIPQGGTIFVVEEERETSPKKLNETPEKEEKKKSGWFKKILEKGGSLQDTSKVEFGIE